MSTLADLSGDVTSVAQTISKLSDQLGNDHSNEVLTTVINISRTLSQTAQDISSLAIPVGDYLDVRDYGALVDGTTDDTAAIQAAIDASVTQGKAVRLGYGTSIVDRLTIPTGLVLFGYGMEQSILKRKASSALDSVLKGTSVNGFELRAFGIDGNKLNESTNSNNIWLATCYDFRIIEVASRNCKGQHISATNHIGHGIYLIDCADWAQDTRSWVVRCRLDNNDHHGLEGHRSGNITIAHSTASANARQGIAFFNFTDPHVTSGNIAGIHIIGNTANNNVVGNGISLPGFWQSGPLSAPIYGIGTNDSYDCVVADNICIGNGRYGIAFQAIRSVMVGNVTTGNTYAGGLFNAGYSQCVGNFIGGGSDYGLDAGGAIKCTFSDNVFLGGGALLNLGASQDCVVSGNVFDTNASGSSTCIGLAGIDGDGTTPFPWVGKNTEIIGNSFIGTSGDLGIWVFRNYRHSVVANNWLTGFDDTAGIRTETVNGQCYGNFTRPGTGDSVTQTYSSATTLILPDHVDFAWISGTTQIDDIQLYSKNLYDGKVMDVNITNQGSGYNPASPPTVSFSSGSAAATAEVSNGGQIIGVNMTNHGSGYLSPPTVSFSSGSAAGTALVSARNNEDRLLTLRFTDSCTVSGPSNNVNLSGNFRSKNNSVLTLYGSSGAWYEVARGEENFSDTAASVDGAGASGSVTLDRLAGVVTTNDANNGENSNFIFTINNSQIASGDIVTWDYDNNTNNSGTSAKARTVVGSGSVQCVIKNLYVGGAGAAFNGNFKIRFRVTKV